jgi:hypothetical protein
MKKKDREQKKLSLNKIQLIKVNQMKRIHGGRGIGLNEGLDNENEDPNTPFKTDPGSLSGKDK